jgi:hypothetical protein
VADLNRQKADLETTLSQLQSQTWGLTMITMQDLQNIREDLKKRKPADLASNSDKPLSNREAVKQLASTLLKMRGLHHQRLGRSAPEAPNHHQTCILEHA